MFSIFSYQPCILVCLFTHCQFSFPVIISCSSFIQLYSSTVCWCFICLIRFAISWLACHDLCSCYSCWLLHTVIRHKIQHISCVAIVIFFLFFILQLGPVVIKILSNETVLSGFGPFCWVFSLKKVAGCFVLFCATIIISF